MSRRKQKHTSSSAPAPTPAVSGGTQPPLPSAAEAAPASPAAAASAPAPLVELASGSTLGHAPATPRAPPAGKPRRGGKASGSATSGGAPEPKPERSADEIASMLAKAAAAASEEAKVKAEALRRKRFTINPATTRPPRSATFAPGPKFTPETITAASDAQVQEDLEYCLSNLELYTEVLEVAPECVFWGYLEPYLGLDKTAAAAELYCANPRFMRWYVRAVKAAVTASGTDPRFLQAVLRSDSLLRLAEGAGAVLPGPYADALEDTTAVLVKAVEAVTASHPPLPPDERLQLVSALPPLLNYALQPVPPRLRLLRAVLKVVLDALPLLPAEAEGDDISNNDPVVVLANALGEFITETAVPATLSVCLPAIEIVGVLLERRPNALACFANLRGYGGTIKTLHNLAEESSEQTVKFAAHQAYIMLLQLVLSGMEILEHKERLRKRQEEEEGGTLGGHGSGSSGVGGGGGPRGGRRSVATWQAAASDWGAGSVGDSAGGGWWAVNKRGSSGRIRHRVTAAAPWRHEDWAAELERESNVWGGGAGGEGGEGAGEGGTASSDDVD